MFGKQKHKTKEELLKETELKYEVNRKRTKIKDWFYPFLLKNSKNIEDAKQITHVLMIAIQGAFNKPMTTMKVNELKMIDLLDPKNEQFEIYKEAFEQLGNETVQSAVGLTEGMESAIDTFVRKDNLKRPLSDLESSFL